LKGEEQYSIFLGGETVSIVDIKKENEKIFAKVPNKFFPMFDNYQHIASNICSKMNIYKERILYLPNEGRTKIKVRIYPFDFDTFEADFKDMNMKVINENKSLRIERDFLYQMMLELKDIIAIGGNMDFVEAKFKKKFDYFHNLKPGYLMNTKPEDKKKK